MSGGSSSTGGQRAAGWVDAQRGPGLGVVPALPRSQLPTTKPTPRRARRAGVRRLPPPPHLRGHGVDALHHVHPQVVAVAADGGDDRHVEAVRGAGGGVWKRVGVSARACERGEAGVTRRGAGKAAAAAGGPPSPSARRPYCRHRQPALRTHPPPAHPPHLYSLSSMVISASVRSSSGYCVTGSPNSSSPLE